ncbi:MAG: hypothetical protein ACYTG5_16795 [Planctomycetota bacterium]|jgi:hypothetical protein
MKEFRVTLTHRAGELARLAQTLAEHHIDLRSVAGISEGNKAEICLVATDVAKMRAALEAARMTFVEEELLSELLEDEVGQIADLTTRLSEAGVNLKSFYILARDNPLVELGFTVDEPKKAKKVLGS